MYAMSDKREAEVLEWDKLPKRAKRGLKFNLEEISARFDDLCSFCVQSMKQLSKLVLQQLKNVEPSTKYKVQVMGLYATGGMGKTTISRAICNQMIEDFGGKVCYIDLAGSNFVDLQQRVLKELANASPSILVNDDHHQLMYLLKQRMHQQNVFLVLDNVWEKQIEEVQMYLNVGYHEGSMVLVTSRSRDVLKGLGLLDCLEVPILDHEGAIDLFLHCTKMSKESIKHNFERVSVSFVEKYQHHPLALNVLGSRFEGIHDLRELKNSLKYLQFIALRKAVHPIFHVLQLGYDALRTKEQNIFLDLGLLLKPQGWQRNHGWKWLCIIHRHSEDDMKVQVLERKGLALWKKGLNGEVDANGLIINIHDLYLEFGRSF